MNMPKEKDLSDQLIELYQQYKTIKKFKESVPKKSLPPLTLDERLESVNPYYVSSETVTYG